MKEWLDVMELAEQTQIADTTVRRYLLKFNQFFAYKGGKRSRRYESSAIKVLLRIKALYGQGFESKEVAKRLGEEFPLKVNGEQMEAELDEAGLPALATAEDMSELKEALKKQTEFSRLLLQNDHEQRELIKALIQSNEEQKKFNESLIQAITSQPQVEVKALPDPEQQEIGKLILQELAESKQREQLLLEKLTEKEEEKEEAAKPPEEKKGFWKNFFK